MFDALAAGVALSGVLSVDLETTGLDPTEAEILLIAMAPGKGPKSTAVAVSPTEEALSFLREKLADPKLRIVGHNFLKFDLQVLHYQNVVSINDIKAKIIDTLPLVWLLNENVPNDLKSAVERIFRYKMVTYDEAYISSPAIQRMRQIDGMVREIRAEAKKIPSVAKRQAQKERKEFYTNLLLKLEKGEITATKKALAEQAKARYGAEFCRSVQEMMKKEAEDRIEGLLGEKRAEAIKAANDQRTYARDDAYQTRRLYLHCRNQLRKDGILQWADLELKVRAVSSQMQINGLAIDRNRLVQLKDTLDPLIDEFEATVYNLAKREFNIRSPEVLKEVLYDDLGIPPVGGIRINKAGKEEDETFSTKEAILSRLQHPVAQQVLNYRTTFKLKSSFVTKLLRLLDKSTDGRIHPSFNTLVRTGRWSCKNPNVQQIPSRKKAKAYDERIQDLGPLIRRAFVSPPGKKLIIGDLSQIELRLAAHFTKDYNLLQTYNEFRDYRGIRFYTGDIHANTAKALGVDRKLAKNLNFGLLFGMTGRGFAHYARLFKPGTVEFDVEAGDEFRSQFMGHYLGIPELLSEIRDARENPYFCKEKFRMISGRFRRFPKEDNAFPGKIFNSIVQGSASDIIKVIIWSLDECVVKNPEFEGTEIVLQVHDEIGMYAPDPIARRVAILMKYAMEVAWFRMDVPVLGSVKVCDDWSHKDNDNVPEIGVMPPKESGIVPCTAMLSKKQRDWAAQYIKPKDFTFVLEEGEE